MQIRVISDDKSCFLSSSFPYTEKETLLQMEIHVLLLDRKGEDREITAFRLKEALCQSDIFGSHIFWSPSNIIAISGRL